jgi:hypothetical protein
MPRCPWRPQPPPPPDAPAPRPPPAPAQVPASHVWVVDHPELQDGMQNEWSPLLVREMVQQAVERFHADTVRPARAERGRCDSQRAAASLPARGRRVRASDRQRLAGPARR